jgi:hypothetical protein
LDKYKESKAAIKIHFIYNIYKVIDPHNTLWVHPSWYSFSSTDYRRWTT